MKKLFTLFSLVIIVSSLNAQLIWEGSFEEPGFGPVTTSVNGTGSFANAGITNTDDFWLNVWSIDSKGTTVTIVNDFSDGAQAFLFEIDETTTDIRMRTSADAVNFVNGEFVKVTLDAKTDAQGVADGGKFISVVKNNFKEVLTDSYKTYELYGAIANNRIQIWFPSTGSGESYKVWVDKVRVEKVDAIPVEPVDPEFTNFPYTEDFESTDYTIGADIAKKNDVDGEQDFWNSGTHPLFDRYWRGNFTSEYLTSVDGDANAGSKAMKLAITTLEGNDFRLRSVNVPAGNYTVTFMAKTDASSLGKAKIGFVEDATTWSTLTETYAEYSGNVEVVVNPNNGTTRLIIFYTSDKAVVGSESYNLWIDDIEVKEMATAIGDTQISEIVTLYPNPTASQLFVKSSAQLDKIEVFNLSGQKVLESASINNGISVAHLHNGIYIASVEVNGVKVIKKFTKK